jgi:hypothetical protein
MAPLSTVPKGSQTVSVRHLAISGTNCPETLGRTDQNAGCFPDKEKQPAQGSQGLSSKSIILILHPATLQFTARLVANTTETLDPWLISL